MYYVYFKLMLPLWNGMILMNHQYGICNNLKLSVFHYHLHHVNIVQLQHNMVTMQFQI